MGFLDRFRRKKASAGPSLAPNPHLNPRVREGGFFSADVGRLLSGWETSSNSIDYYLGTELRPLRARSRRMVRMNPYGKRFVQMIRSNVVGPKGINAQARSVIRKGGRPELDTLANDAIEAAFADWASNHCDYLGRSSWVDLQQMAISCAAQDGEFLFEKVWGNKAGKYGFQLKAIDPELLDVEKNTKTKRGEIRLGVEYDSSGRVIRYHFVKRNQGGTYSSAYRSTEHYSIPAQNIIHGYISEWPDQSRGIPWMHAGLERAKHLEKFDESAIVNARAGASTMAVIHGEGAGGFGGDEEGTGEYEGATLEAYEAGTIKDIGDRMITQLDPAYPHQMYEDFVKATLRAVAGGLGVSYHSLSNDLEGVNYSSIRAGVLEDREIFKGLQEWFIRALVKPVYEDWLRMAVMKEAIKIGQRPLSRPINDYYPAHFQPRRWAWVDPQKDGAANQMALDSRLKSHSQLMREQGDDPDTVWREIQRDQERMKELGIEPVTPMNAPQEGEDG